jgi:putative two-component system response regulator
MRDKSRIVVVDDDLTSLDIAKFALGETYDVVLLSNAYDLMRMLLRNDGIKPDLILLDVLMPVLNGFDTLKMLKQNKSLSHIPVIMLSSQHDIDSQLLGLHMGAVDYIIKPFTPILLQKRIEIQLQYIKQKGELELFNKNLNSMVRTKCDTIANLQYAIVQMLGKLSVYRDYADGGHVARTTLILSHFIEKIPFDSTYGDILREWHIPEVLQSSSLYDIGKITIADAIKLKRGSLDEEEWAEMKSHAGLGEQMIGQLQERVDDSVFLEHAKIMAATHHERWDGSGYPRGLKHDQIPLQGRLMAFADAYDALVSKRPYREAYSHYDALAKIYEMGGRQFDPDLTDIFVEAMVERHKFDSERAA